MPATRPYIPRITLAFDFDETLATDSIDAILQLYEIDRDQWEERYKEPLGDDWDVITQRGQALIDMGRERAKPLTLDLLREAAGHVRLYDGVTRMPDILRKVAREIDGSIEVEFVVLSSGFAELIQATAIDDVFDRTFASTFAFDDDGTARCVKRVISHPQKALYLEALGKNVEIDGANAPERAGNDVDEYDRHVLFDQMIYLGDGASDLQAFGFLSQAGGLSIAIDKGGEFNSADEQSEHQRVDSLAPPDYSEGGELLRSLRHAVSACAHRIALRSGR